MLRLRGRGLSRRRVRLLFDRLINDLNLTLDLLPLASIFAALFLWLLLFLLLFLLFRALLLGGLLWLLLLATGLGSLSFLVGRLLSFGLLSGLGVLLLGESLVVLALLFTPLIGCLVVNAAQVGDLVNQHVDKLLIVDVVGIMSYLRLCAKHDIMGFLWVGR